MGEDGTASELVRQLLLGAESFTDLPVSVGEHDLTFRYRRLSWLSQARCISEATEYVPTNVNGRPGVKATFRLDIYKRVAVEEMFGNIPDQPFPLTRQVVERLPVEVGVAFDRVIPDPFSGMVEESESVKPGPAAS